MVLAAALSTGTVQPATAQVTLQAQAIAESASGSDEIAAYYRARDFAPIWTEAGEAAAARRSALLTAIDFAPLHGLPASRYDVDALLAQMGAARTAHDRGVLDVALTRIYLRLARDLQTGMLTPAKVVPEIIREVPLRDASQYLDGILSADPVAFVHTLPPHNGEYVRLMKAKFQMERLMQAGGYGATVPATQTMKPGQSGRAVIALRDRLTAMGYLKGSFTSTYDADIEAAVRAYQSDMSMNVDGVVGPATLGMINTSVEDRLKSVIVAMERERWLNRPRGDRHVLVNLADFSAKIVDFDRVTFETRAVIGANSTGRRSPEFSDVMEFMIINPTWHVPRSIVVKEYLPQLQQNPYAAAQLNVIDRNGTVVPRGAIDWRQFNARTFPFEMKQPPSNSNALGLVKFMFPNANNIYLHDTPSKSLFARDSRAFSHGCIRLQDPFDFAYALLAPQMSDPKSFFQAKLASGRETQVNLETPIQVHLIYRTAVTTAKGGVSFRDDVYGRDRAIWDALAAEGVTLAPVRG
ncbi:murein L,D-transpeptidase [Pseudooceanicola sediminis]|uniref:Murein L,D-transpeptidase n=2 Tax=Pseudooceanicola sediminis TaxID=2211117 RepID=A0A399J5N0_9RHOB|nr:L,D-transpeptidase family protein [Puniceibacterium sp. HSS470]RII40798.1 murein L,D-transpeptidase [Pseudooceanicola sediminis]|tara:strand:+ start:115953 stop:117524 length:1572 start_codon:yes stop_codon:yes gene_type:complete